MLFQLFGVVANYCPYRFAALSLTLKAYPILAKSTKKSLRSHYGSQDLGRPIRRSPSSRGI
jgi:hypothetical protein